MDILGLSFPFRIDRTTGRSILSENENHIKEAINRIIEYKKYDLIGEAIGSDAPAKVFDVKSGLMISNLIADVKTAIGLYVTEVTSVFVSLIKTDEGLLQIAVKYKLKETSAADDTSVLL